MQDPRGVIQKALRKQNLRRLLTCWTPEAQDLVLTPGGGLVLPPPEVDGKTQQKSEEWAKNVSQ